jgi:phosphoglucosamine mutase
MKKKYFGTDGVRGRVGGPVINADVMTKLGWAIGMVLKNQSPQQQSHHVIIGRDTRESGDAIELNLQEGLLSAGVDVSILGVISTPAVAHLTREYAVSAGIIISASHNPYEDNGVKVVGSDGFKLSDDIEFAIEHKMESSFFAIDKSSRGKLVSITDAASHYVAHCIQLFKKKLSLQGLKLVIDCANGATVQGAEQIFSELGATVVMIHASPNGKNINAQCGATDLKSLQESVLREKADCGIAFDGDGDRLMMVDHFGECVDGDEILCILALDDTQHHAGIVGTLMSNLGLEKALKSSGIPFERAAVGDRYVLEKLQHYGWRLGGEGSGHIVNLNYATTGDGIITALQVLQIMKHKNQSLHKTKQVMKKRPQILVNVRVSEPARFAAMDEITEAVSVAEKKLNGSGRILLRASGTESCVRVMVECDEESQARSLAQSVAKVVEDCFAMRA